MDKCPVVTLRSNYTFYKRTSLLNPRGKPLKSDIVTGKEIIAVDQRDHKEKIEARLPFTFPFYGLHFKTARISPTGSIDLEDEAGGYNETYVASIMVYVSTSASADEDALHSVITYGSTSVEVDDFVVRWNNSYEAILSEDGTINLRYISIARYCKRLFIPNFNSKFMSLAKMRPLMWLDSCSLPTTGVEAAVEKYTRFQPTSP